MKPIKRFLSLLLVLTLCCTALPVYSLAEEMESIDAIQMDDMIEMPIEAQASENIETPAPEAAEEFELMEIIETLPEEGDEAAPDSEIAADPTPEAQPDAAIDPEATIAPEASAAPEASPLPEGIWLDAAYYARFLGENEAEISLEDLKITLPADALPISEIEGLEADADYALQGDELTIFASWLYRAEAGEQKLILHGGADQIYILPILLEDALLMQDALAQNLAPAALDVSQLYVNGLCLEENPSGEGWNYDPETGVLRITAASASISGSGVLKYIASDVSPVNITLDHADISFIPWEHEAGQGTYSEAFTDTQTNIQLSLIGANRLNADWLARVDRSKPSLYYFTFSGDGSLNCGDIFVHEIILNSNSTLTAKNIRGTRISVGGELNAEQVVVPQNNESRFSISGGTANLDTLESLYVNIATNYTSSSPKSGTLNITGGSEYGLYVRKSLQISGGKLNVTRHADGLDYTAIRCEGSYQHENGDISINLSGASDFTGLYIKPSSTSAFFGGTFSMQTSNASSVRGIWYDSTNSFESNVQYDLQFNGTAGEATGIYTLGKLDLKAASKIHINGGSSICALNSKGTLTFENDVDIQLRGAKDGAVGFVAKSAQLKGGHLSVDVDVAIPMSYAMDTQNDFNITGGTADLSAGWIAPSGVCAALPDGSTVDLNSSRLIWDGSQLNVPARTEFFINEIRHSAVEGEANLSGDGWEFNTSDQTLYLNGFNGESIRFLQTDACIHLSGENAVQQVFCIGLVEFTGDGSLSFSAGEANSFSAIDTTDALLTSGKLKISGYTHGISAYNVEIAGGSLEIKDCDFGITTDTLDIGEACALKLQANVSAFKIFDEAKLVDEAFNASGYTAVDIENGKLISSENALGLQVGDAFFAEAELAQDQSGEGWQWNAKDQQLLLGEFTGGKIVSSMDELKLHAQRGVSGLTISAQGLILSADSGVWLRNAYVDAFNFELNSGNIYLRNDQAHIFNTLKITGGRMNASNSMQVQSKLSVSGGALNCQNLYVGDLAISGGSVNITDEAIGFYEINGVANADFCMVAGDCVITGGELKTVGVPYFGSYKQSGGKANLCTIAAQQENAILSAVFVKDAFTATGGSISVKNANEAGIAMQAGQIRLSGKLSCEFYGGACLFICDDFTVGGKKKDGTKYQELTMSKGKTTALALIDQYWLQIGDQYFTSYMVKNMNFGGNGWYWNHESKTLTLSGYKAGGEIALSNIGATIHVKGGSENKVYEIYSEKSLTLTGTGALDCETLICWGSVAVSGVRNVHMSIQAAKNISVKNSYLFDSLYADGSISITGSNIYVERGEMQAYNSITIKSSMVCMKYGIDYAIGCNKKLSVSDSLVISESIFAGSKSISSNAAVFDDFYLARNATLNRSFTVPSGIQLYIPSGRTLTIKSGKTLSGDFRIEAYGKLKGDCVSLGYADGLRIVGPESLAIGGSCKLEAVLESSKAANIYTDVLWKTEDPSLCEIAQDGTLRLTNDARSIGKALVIYAYGGSKNALVASHTIQILPAVEEIVLRRNGVQVKNAELWLDPNVNNSIAFTAHLEPVGTSEAITWKSSNAKIVSVDENGVVTAKKAGSAYVYAVAADGSNVASPKVKITVKKAPTSVKFTSGNPVLGYDAENGMGASKQLAWKFSSGSASSASFQSQDESIAIVDESGLVTATGVGKTKITVRSYNGKKASCTVTVKAAPASIELNAHELTIGTEDHFDFTAAIPENAVGDWSFSVSNANASIDAKTGRFTAKTAGETEVVVRSFNGKTDTCKVTILPAPDMIVLSRGGFEMGKGEAAVLNVKPGRVDGAETAATLSFSTSNKKVATVNAAGKITAKAVGKAIITVRTHNDVVGECIVQVSKAPTSVKLAKSAVMGYDAVQSKGTQLQLLATLSSKSASALTWSSADESVATVDENGLVTATGVGTVKITVRTFNKKSASCTITVLPAPMRMVFDQDAYIIAVDDQIRVYAEANSGSYAPDAKYEIEDESIAIVDAYGHVLPAATGETRLIARAFNGAEGYANLKVVDSPTKLSLNAESMALKKGKKFTLQPEVARADGAETAASYAFFSSNAKVASVSADGVITAKAKGKATISVITHNGLTAEIVIKVP